MSACVPTDAKMLYCVSATAGSSPARIMTLEFRFKAVNFNLALCLQQKESLIITNCFVTVYIYISKCMCKKEDAVVQSEFVLKSPRHLLCAKAVCVDVQGSERGAGELKTHRSIPSQTKTTAILLTLERPWADVDSAVGSDPWTLVCGFCLSVDILDIWATALYRCSAGDPSWSRDVTVPLRTKLE